MKNLLITSALILGLSASLTALAADSSVPVVVSTIPLTNAKDIAPGLTEIRVTFSKPMQDSATFTPVDQKKPIAPDLIASKPSFSDDHKTFILKLNLKPNTKYAFWINSPKFKNFKDTSGQPSTPYQLTFQTKAE
ncbi:MAG: Ig-like domain-containing protein [Nibricoccus sp.]